MRGEAAVHPTVRAGIIDMMGPAAQGSFSRFFTSALEDAAAALSLSLDLLVFAFDPALCRLNDAIDWSAVAELDGLIVTGTQPTSQDIADEPALRVVDRLLAVGTTVNSTIFSCLSAHAALYSMHGIRRHRLLNKRVGVYSHSNRANSHPLTVDLSPVVNVPHSRWHGASSEDLRSKGLTIGLDDPQAGTGQHSSELNWHLATSSDGYRFTFLQGHPEYRTDTLGREYRRDARLWTTGALTNFPELPANYYLPAWHEALTARTGRRRGAADLQLAADIPLPMNDEQLESPWLSDSACFFINWTRVVSGQLTSQQQSQEVR